MDKVKSIFPNCILCQKIVKDKVSVFEHKNPPFLYTLFHCKNCDLQFFYPLKYPQKLNAFQAYDSCAILEAKSLFSRITRFILGSSWNHGQFFRDNPISSGRLLDIGFGDGRFLRECKKRGFKVYGLEVSKKDVELIQQEGIDAFYGTTEQFVTFWKGKPLFDWITCFETLEHLFDPALCLKSIWLLLRPGGKLVVSVPLRTRAKILFTTQEDVDTPPGHMTSWSFDALRYALEHSGFKVEKMMAQPFTLRYVIGSFFRAKALDKVFPRKGIRKFIRAFSCLMLALIVFVPLKLSGKKNGLHLYVIARKVNNS